MKRAFLLLFTFIIFISAHGQKNKGQVFLKNGSIIKGKILESGSGIVRISSAGNFWVFPQAEVEKISYFNEKDDFLVEQQASKIYFHTEIGVLAGNSNNEQFAPFSFQGSANYSISKKLAMGLGAGLEFLQETHMPVFMNTEYSFRNTKFSPYAFLQVGYAFPIEESREYYHIVPYYSYSSYWPYPDAQELDAKGGVLINPGIGIKTMFTQNFGMTFSFGYRFSRLQYKGEGEYSLNADYNRLTLKLGIIFN